MSKNSQIHPCSGKCQRFNGEQCSTCLVSDDVCDFAVGDLVAIKSSWKPNNKRLYEIEDIKGTSVRVSAYIPHLHKFSREILGFCIGIENIRTATLAEKAAGYRIDETEEELLAEAEVWRECREPCRFDRLEAEPENGWAVNPTQNNVVCTEVEPLDLFNSKHCSPRNYIKQYYNNVTDAQRLKELDASVDRAKATLATFNYEPLPTPCELKQAEQIRVLRTDRNVWCAMFFIAVVGYGVARWML